MRTRATRGETDSAGGYVIMPGMKVVFNAHLLSGRAGYRSAGIHAYISNLLRHLPAQAEADWQFQALVGRGAPAIPGIDMRRSAWSTETPIRRIIWEQALQPAAIRQAELYHAMAFVAPLLLPAPMVVTVYDLSFLRYPQRLSPARRLYLRQLTALTCRRARRILAISQSTADDISAMLGIAKSKIDVTPLGYDEARFMPRPAAEIAQFRQKHKLPERFWLYVGTLEPRKNLGMLLEAYASLRSAERLPLVLGGGLGWRGQDILAAIERLGISDSVRHIGFIPAADLPFWYNCAEVFVYPSLYEGFGLPALEAMACGSPVLCSDVSSLPEVAGEAGLCLPPHDRQAWADALKAGKAAAAWREEAREAGLARAKSFSWARTAKLTLRSYRRAMAAPEAGPGERDEVSGVHST